MPGIQVIGAFLVFFKSIAIESAGVSATQEAQCFQSTGIVDFERVPDEHRFDPNIPRLIVSLVPVT
jgi:hypothetical protein